MNKILKVFLSLLLLVGLSKQILSYEVTIIWDGFVYTCFTYPGTNEVDISTCMANVKEVIICAEPISDAGVDDVGGGASGGTSGETPGTGITPGGGGGTPTDPVDPVDPNPIDNPDLPLDCQCNVCPHCGGCIWEKGELKMEGCEPCSCSYSFALKSEEYDCDNGFVYEQVWPRDPDDNKYDCSEWVYFIINKLNPALARRICSSQTNVNTASFKNYINSNGGFRKNDPKVGDIVMWSGHIEFVVEVSGQKFVMHGCRSTKYCAPSQMGKSENCYIWLNTNYNGIESLGTGSYLGFWTPK